MARERTRARADLIVIEGAYAPYNFTKPDGTLDGYEIELGREICARAKIKRWRGRGRGREQT
jgi:ABC-type amino acid transport substrate-binding protein